MNRALSVLWVKRNVLALFALLVTGVIALGAAHVKLDNHYSIFFAPDNEDLKAHQWMESVFTKNDNILVVVTPRAGDIFNRDTLTRLHEFTELAWKLPYVERVDSITNFQAVESDSDSIVIAPLVNPEVLQGDLSQLRARVMQEPEIQGFLLSKDATTTAINISLNMPKEAEATPEIMAKAREQVERMFPQADYQVHLHGIVALNNAFMESTDRDGQRLIPVMFGLMLVLIALCLRSLWQSLAVSVVIALGSVSTLGFIGWLGLNINMVNIVSVTIILTLAVADCVHIAAHYSKLRQQGFAREAALADSVSLNLKALFLTSLTTALGFLGLLSSDSPPIRELGLVTALGVSWVFILTLAIFPALLYFIPVHSKNSTSAISSQFSIGIRLHKYRYCIVFGMLAVSLISIVGAQKNTINDHASRYFKDTAGFKQATLDIEKRLTGLDVLAFALDSGEENGVNDIRYLQSVDAFGAWLREQPEVVHVQSYTDVLKRINRAMHDGDREWYLLPDSEALAAQYLLVYGMSASSGLGVTDRVSFDNRVTRMAVNLKIDNPAQLIALDNRARAWLSENAPTVAVKSASVPKLFAFIGINNIKSMMLGNVVGVLLISLVLSLAFRSLKWGIVSMLPNAFPAVIALGLWGVFSGTVNLAVTIVFSITLGIIVDDTIHFLSKYIFYRKKGHDPIEAIDCTYRQVGAALVYTTVVLASGFAVLAFSDFNVNAQMGLMVSVTLVIALAFDIVFLPALLLVVDGRAASVAWRCQESVKDL